MRPTTENPAGSAVRIALIYAVIAAIWILSSDLLLVGISDPRLYATLSVLKGWAFVVVTAGLLYVLVRRTIRRILHAETRAALIFNSVNDPILLFYLEDGSLGTFTDANDAALERLGYTLEELRTMTPFDLVAPSLLGEAKASAAKLWEEGRTVLESCMVTKDGRLVPVEVSARTVTVGGMVMGVTVARDITERKREETLRREEAVAAERDKRRFYRETILAVTGGKFELADPADAKGWIVDPDISRHLSASDELADARHDIVEYCRQAGMVDESIQEFELAVGEALGNAIKHAGEAWLYAGSGEDKVWVGVVDHGTGIDTFTIPKVALLAGFTTKESLGLGYTLILRACDHVRLATGSEGTTVVMEKRLRPASELERRLAAFTGVE